ncbi:polysaccharide export protein EpsE [Janthinobacterium sp. HH01]|uniref:polysaccharide export protein EpsE n=1 Tax=Janthinobacterium sp. HH01 TaxID=1198452 RepID=UPI0002AEBFED|nr:polysaccharide export protein EpsE [Janthinobacterium sp. HH01]ELX13290.1 polysaccharide export protein EpsE [Janthinobacterium sp. HH01]
MKRLAMWMVAGMLALLAQTAGAADVLLGAGDVVKVSVYGNQDLSLETRVSEAGTITFPLIGTVELGGLTAAAAEKKIAGMLEGGGFIRKAQVNLLVTSLQSAQVSVLGAVNRPGRYPIEGKRTLMDMLALAGGFGGDGGDVVSLIRKRNGVTTKDAIDVVDMVRGNDFNRDFEVMGGDILYVERAPRFYIYGEVQRPGPFRLERQMTLLQALSTGGGLTPRGTERGIRIKRRDAKGVLQVIEAKQDDLVQVDDVIYVKESLF